MSDHNEERLEEVVSEFAARIGRDAETAFYADVIGGIGLCESPIERLLAAAFKYTLESSEWYFEFFGARVFSELPLEGDFRNNAPEQPGIYIYPQAPVGRWRTDFLVIVASFDGGLCCGAVECDGHDFHERTKEQAAHDKERDREFQAAGLLVLRYTGSEIWKSPLRCATDAIGILHRRAREQVIKVER